MCFADYFGTSNNLKIGKFIAEKTDIYFEELSLEEEKNGLRSKFTKPNIYYVGSDSSCSCGLAYESGGEEDSDEIEDDKSPRRFIEFLKEETINDDVEYYCCWERDWSLPIEHFKVVDIREVELEKNYFGLNEREFIKFTKQTL